MRNRHLNIVFFMLVIFTLFTINLLIPKKASVSEIEKRALELKPVLSLSSIFGGRYFVQYEDYFTDHFVWRDQLVEWSGLLKKSKGILGEEDIRLVVSRNNNMQSSMNSPVNEEEAVPAMSSHAEEQEESSEEEMVGQYLVYKDNAYLLYYFNPEAAKRYAGALNEFQQRVDAEQLRVYSLLVPSKIEFVGEEKLKKLTMPQKAAVDLVKETLQESITPVDAYSKLEEHKEEYIYFRSDHHWTALGAYYAYEAFAEAAGYTMIPLAQYDTEEYPGFLGTSYAATLSTAMKRNPDVLTLYKPSVSSTLTVSDGESFIRRELFDKQYSEKDEKYSTFLGGDFGYGILRTKSGTNRVLMVIKDSYANALIPFLIPHYKEIHIIDPRYYTGNIVRAAKEAKADEVLFLNSSIVGSYFGISNFLLKSMEVKQRN